MAAESQAVEESAAQSRLVGTLRARSRQLELGLDPERGFIASEGAAGVRIEQALGRTITRSADNAADFVDRVLGPISLKGPIPAQGSVSGLANAAVKDALTNTATKALFVDLTGLSSEAATVVRNTVMQGAAKTTKTIFFLGN
jgi:hypothetical protein